MSTNDPTTPSDHERETRHLSRRVGVRMTFLLVFAIIIAGVAFVGESLGHTTNSSKEPTITVTGSGTVTGTPDTLSFQIGAQNVAPSAVAALSANNVEMQKLESTLLQHGIAKKNLQTSGLNIYPNMNQSGAVTGFTVSDTLNVTTHHLASAGSALDAAARAVGNDVQLNGITFSISNQSKLLASARARAMKSAHTEAVQIASGANTSVGSVVSVVDQENTGSTGIVFGGQLSLTHAAAAIPLESGSQSIDVQVTVVYRLAS